MTSETEDRASARVLAEVRAERRRQVDVEGWSAEHDDEHIDGAMANIDRVMAENATLRAQLLTLATEEREACAKHLEMLSKAAGERRKEYYAEKLLDAALKYSHQEDNFAEAAQAIRSRTTDELGDLRKRGENKETP